MLLLIHTLHMHTTDTHTRTHSRHTDMHTQTCTHIYTHKLSRSLPVYTMKKLKSFYTDVSIYVIAHEVTVSRRERYPAGHLSEKQGERNRVNEKKITEYQINVFYVWTIKKKQKQKQKRKPIPVLSVPLVWMCLSSFNMGMPKGGVHPPSYPTHPKS